ncbi:MAG: tyrosine-type recombinase/integrase [Candidatus Gastranaerophilales bacterium]|nr:tyrosine-type recombinase/integrase [Candidatus Gastranaerophilales bacterium]
MAKVKKRVWINKDGSKGQTWTVDFIDNRGKRAMKSGFKTKAEAENYLAKLRLELEKGTCINSNKNLTFHLLGEEFIKNYAEIYCKTSTLIGYKSYLKNHLYPFFSHKKILDITPNFISKYIQLKKDEGFSNKTINHTLILLGGIFKRAMEQGYITRNPAYSVKKLKLEHLEMGFLYSKEIKILLESTKEKDPDFYPILLTAISTGLRRGELIALNWSDINFKECKISVSKSIFRGQIQEPKTKTSIRKVNMPRILIDVLKELKEKSKSEIIFTNKEGNHLDPDNMVKRHFLPNLKSAGINKQIRFHDLRHTFASALIAQNVPIKYIQAQMGHSSIQVTLDRYGHLMPEVHLQGIDAMEKILE